MISKDPSAAWAFPYRNWLRYSSRRERPHQRLVYRHCSVESLLLQCLLSLFRVPSALLVFQRSRSHVCWVQSRYTFLFQHHHWRWINSWWFLLMADWQSTWRTIELWSKYSNTAFPTLGDEIQSFLWAGYSERPLRECELRIHGERPQSWLIAGQPRSAPCTAFLLFWRKHASAKSTCDQKVMF